MNDKGHKKLIEDLEQIVNDLKAILVEAKDFQFHDFENKKYPFPKHILKTRLDWIGEKIVAGEYDNVTYDNTQKIGKEEGEGTYNGGL
jgi:hypothetical protein